MIIDTENAGFEFVLVLDDVTGKLLTWIRKECASEPIIKSSKFGHYDFNKDIFIFKDEYFQSLMLSTDFKTAATLASL